MRSALHEDRAGGAEVAEDRLLGRGRIARRQAVDDRLVPGTVLLSGTIPMIAGVDQFADAWRVELTDPRGLTSRVVYTVEQLAPAWE